MPARALCALTLIGAVTLVSCGGGQPAPPSESAAAQSPAVQSAILRDLLNDWQMQKDMMMKAADAMPEDKFSFKSTPAQRSYGEQIMHVATANAELLKLLAGKAPAPAFTAESAKTKAEMLMALAESYDYGTALLKEQTEASIGQDVPNAPSWLGPATKGRIVWNLLTHSMDIYGQMVVYLRLNGIVPPASRGV